MKITESFNGCHSIGSYKKIDEIPAAVQQAMGLNDVNVSLRRYLRLLKGRLIFVAELYQRSLQTNSAFVAYELNNIKYFGKILYFNKLSYCDCYEDKCFCAGVHKVVLNTIRILGNLAIGNPPNVILQHMFQCEVMNDIIVIPVENLITPCFTMSNNNFLYIAEPVNKYEFE